MTASALMEPRVRSVGLDDTVAAVQSFMVREGLSWVPVLAADGSAIGVLSAVDLLRFHENKRDAAVVPAWQLCTYKPVIVDPDAPVETVAALMSTHQVHHVVVMRDGQIEGVVSSLDVLKTLAADAPAHGPSTPR
jgi:CBS domain-containing protein